MKFAMRSGYFFVYILKCSDGTYYTGVTNNLDRRLTEHSNGTNKNAYTFKRRPLTLVYSDMFMDINQAIAFEKKLKKWSKAKKEALINEEFNHLPDLSKKLKIKKNTNL